MQRAPDAEVIERTHPRGLRVERPKAWVVIWNFRDPNRIPKRCARAATISTAAPELLCKAAVMVRLSIGIVLTGIVP